jgi:thymidine kinase
MSDTHREGKLDIMIGCMFSGKSSALLRKLSQLDEMGEKVLYINHSIDTRESTTKYSTHCRLTKGRELRFDSIKLTNFENFTIEASYTVVGIDEAQFFDNSLLNFVEYLLNDKRYVIVVGLDGTFERKSFGHILQLIPLADNVVKLHAYCKICYDKNKILKTAIFSHRTVNSSSETLVGASESYIPVCRGCYREVNEER